MNIRIQLSRQTVKALQARLQQAYRQDDVRLVCRINALLDHLVNAVPVSVLAERWGFSPSTFYEWLVALLVRGLVSLVYQRRSESETDADAEEAPVSADRRGPRGSGL